MGPKRAQLVLAMVADGRPVEATEVTEAQRILGISVGALQRPGSGYGNGHKKEEPAPAPAQA